MASTGKELSVLCQLAAFESFEPQTGRSRPLYVNSYFWALTLPRRAQSQGGSGDVLQQRRVSFPDLCSGRHQPQAGGSGLHPFCLSSDIVSTIILPVSCLCLLSLARLAAEGVNWHFGSFPRVYSRNLCLGEFLSGGLLEPRL